MITVMGPTGHTGRKITEALHKVGEKLRALGRSESKLAEIKRPGIEVLTGEAAVSIVTGSLHEPCWHHPSLWGLLPEKTDPIPVVPEWPEFIKRLRQLLAVTGQAGAKLSTEQ